MGLHWTIYCHIHIMSGRRYIGLTKKTMMHRWNRHVYAAFKRNDGSHFANAIRKYGKDTFSHEILWVFYDLENANLGEEWLINWFDTRNPQKGFNIAKGGSHTPHPIKNPWDRPEYREKCLSNLAKANVSLTPEIRSVISLERWNDPEYRSQGLLNLAKANAGLTPEVRSARSIQFWSDPEYRDKVLTTTQEAIRTPEFRKSASERLKEQWKDPVSRTLLEEASRRRALDPDLIEAARERWDDPFYRDRCSIGTKAFNESRKLSSHCPKGHLYTKDSSTPSGWARECHKCAYERRLKARISCPKGHLYGPDTKFNSAGHRICDTCHSESKGPRPCSKCGLPKSRRSGGRFKCGPCTDTRTRIWRARKELP